MRPRVVTIADSCCGSLRFLNYEIHLIQHGLALLARSHPWFGVPLSFSLLVVAWSLYWTVYPILLILTMGALAVRPIELILRRG